MNTLSRPKHPPNRLQRIGYNVPRNVGLPLVELDARQLLLVEYVVHGCSKPRLVEPFGLKPGVPLPIEQAADVVGIKRRNARRLAATPIFQRAMAKAVSDLRTGAHARAVNRMVTLIDEPGAGKAADRKVQLAAAQATLGEEAKGASLNVQINNNVQQIAGYVIRVPAKE